MSQPRFAAITAGLLARKGEARPWTELEKPALKQALAWRSAETPPPIVAPHAKPEPCAEPHIETPAEAPMEAHIGSKADWKKYVLRISHHDYERLGILAVKQGKTRQRLLQETVDQLFTGMTQVYGRNCPCLGGEKRA